MSSDAHVEVEPIETATLRIPKAYIFRRADGNRLAGLADTLRPGAPALACPCLSFVVRHPAAGTILIDTGLHAQAADGIRGDFGTRMGLVFRTLKPADVPYDEQLREHGVVPSEVRTVVMTHLHVDHTSGMRLLPGATFVCANDEWTAAHARGAGGRGYVAGHLPGPDRVRRVDFAREGSASDGFERVVDLLGDGSVRLISTPGHSAGHMSVLLRAGGGRRVLVAGDAVYTLQSLRDEVPPLLTDDDRLYRNSVRQLKAFAERAPDAVVVPSHDPTAWRALQAP